MADALTTLYAESLESHHLALGLHYAEGEVWDKAVVHLRRAGARAFERSANREAVACFERALVALAHLPNNRSTLEQGFDIRLELHPVRAHLPGEPRRTLERLREAEVLAERLNDERRRGRVCASMIVTHAQLAELDEALACGARALEIAGRLEDLRLRIPTTSFLAQAYTYRGEYARVVELATDNLAALPAEWRYECFGLPIPPSVFDRVLLGRSLAELGRFTEAAEYQSEAIRLAELTQHAYTKGMAYRDAGNLYLLEGDWAKARLLSDHGTEVFRTANNVDQVPDALALSAVVLAQLGETRQALDRLAEGEQLLERQVARGFIPRSGWDYQLLSRACLLLGRLDNAQRFSDRAVEFSQRHPGFAAHAQHLLGDVETHPDSFDAARGETHYRQALALAEPRGMRPLVARCHLGLGKLYLRTDKREQARERLATATMMYREMGMTFWLEKAEAEMTEPGR